MGERPWGPPRYEHKSGMYIPRYANIGQDCGSAEHGTIRRHHSWGLLTPTSYHKSFLKDIEAEIYRNSKAPCVKNFRENYEGGQLPIYALVEVFSFGTLSKFYKNMKNGDKKIVAKLFCVGYTYLESWLESIAYVRNICVHYGRLYNAKLAKTPILYKEYSKAGIRNMRVSK